MDLEFLMYRIMRGYIEYNGERIYDPLYRTKYWGRKVYVETKANCKNVLDDDDVFILLVDLNKWDSEKEEKLKDLPREIDNKKVEIFNAFYSVAHRKNLELAITYSKNLFSKLNMERNQYFNYTEEGIAVNAMWVEMIKRMYRGTDTIGALHFYQSNMVDEDTIRDIAISGVWQTYFGASKNVFGKPSIKMTDFQRRLLTWSQIYNNVKSHPDCPNDPLIRHHDAFDGWMIDQQRKESTKKKIDKTFTGRKIREDAKTVFIMGKTKEEIDEIYSMNESNSMLKIRSMEKQIIEEKRVKDINFKHRKIMK